MLFVDRIGRKPLLLIGSMGTSLTLGAMAVVFATAGVGPDGNPLLGHTAAVVGLTAANLYIVAFAVSWGPVIWVLLGEMFPGSWSRAFRRHQLDRQLHRHCHFPTVVDRNRSDGLLRALRHSCSDLAPLCVAHRA